jgi:hypothetical protein
VNFACGQGGAGQKALGKTRINKSPATAFQPGFHAPYQNVLIFAAHCYYNNRRLVFLKN